MCIVMHKIYCGQEDWNRIWRERMVSDGQRYQTKGHFTPLSVQSVPRMQIARLDSYKGGKKNGKRNYLQYGDDTITLAGSISYLK